MVPIALKKKCSSRMICIKDDNPPLSPVTTLLPIGLDIVAALPQEFRRHSDKAKYLVGLIYEKTRRGKAEDGWVRLQWSLMGNVVGR
jgi:hypothetical protein